MNKVERVRAALAGAEVDRVPASFWFHFPSGQKQGIASVKAHLAYYRASGVDFLKIMNEHPYHSGPDKHINATIKTPADWKALRPAPLSASFFQEQLDEISRIVDGLHGECLAITTIFGPFSAGNAISDGRVTEHLKTDPIAVSQGLGVIAESLAQFAIACIEAGAAGIYYSAQGGEQDRFTADEFAGFLKPHDLTVLNALSGHGEFNLLHICGDHIRLPLYADYPTHAVNWASTKHNLDLKQGYSLFKRPVVGGIGDRGLIVDGPHADIKKAVQKVITDFGRRSLMIGADCTVPTEIDVSNLQAAVEASM